MTAEEAEAGGDRYVTKWQQVEELRCPLVCIDEPGRNSGEAAPAAAPTGTPQPARVPLALRPGHNVLSFLAGPIKRGLYTPLHIRAMLHELPLQLSVRPPPSSAELLAPPGSPGSLVPGRHTSTDGGGASVLRAISPFSPEAFAAVAQLAGQANGSNTHNAVPEDIVLMSVGPARARVSVALAAASGVVNSGQRQWLGLVVRPAGDELQGAGMEVAWPLPGLPPPALAAARLGRDAVSSSALNVRGSHGGSRVPAHRAAASIGGPLAGWTGSGSGAMAPSPAEAAVPMLRPEQRLVVVQPFEAPPTSSSGDQGGAAAAPAIPGGGKEPGELVWAEPSTSGSAAWLLGEGHRQELALPRWAWQRPTVVWWWVDAGQPGVEGMMSARHPACAIASVVRLPAPVTLSFASAPSYSGEFVLPPESVRVAPAAPRAVPWPHDHAHHPGSPGDAGTFSPPALLDLSVNLEYTSGCQRSHSRVLAVPVRQPFAVHTSARELPGGRGLAVQFSLTSCLGVPAALLSLRLAPQPGFEECQNLLASLGALPVTLAPRASLTATFLLRSSVGLAGGDRLAALAKLQQAAKLQPTALTVEYTVELAALCGAYAAAVAPDGLLLPLPPPVAGQQQQQQQQQQSSGGSSALTPAAGVLQQLRVAAPASRAGSRSSTVGEGSGDEGASPTASSVAAAGAASASQLCKFRHLCTLELSAQEDEGGTEALVFIRLLGPFTAVVGRPVTLCWRLERCGAVESSQRGSEASAGRQDMQEEALPATRLHYEVSAEGESWRPLGRRGGSVSLRAHDGAVATIEATWLPLAPGTVPVPSLHLGDVRYQELFDPGSTENAISVVAPAARG